MRHTIRSAAKSAALAALGLAALTPTVARAQTQDLFVTNEATNTITRFAGTGPGTFASAPTTLTGPSLSNPFGLAFDARADLFVANATGGSGLGSITELAAGTTPGTFGATTTFTDLSFNSPSGLTFDARGDLFVTNYFGGSNSQGSITEFAAGATPGTFGAVTTLTSGLNGPNGLAFDARGDLFAANNGGSISNGQGSITEFPVGAAPGTFGPPTNFTDPSLIGANGLAFDAKGDLFVTASNGGSNGRGSITEFATGATAGTFGTPTNFTAASLNGPYGLAFDARGDLFTANISGGTITEFAFNPVAGTLGAGAVVESGLPSPTFLAFGPAGPPIVPEASQAVSLGLLLILGAGGVVMARKRRKA